MNRISKEKYYLNIAREVSRRSPCSRRKFGSIIVKDDVIISTGYNGSGRGVINCGTEMSCLKDKYNEEHYTSYNYCSAIHSEVNAIINASRHGTSIVGGTLYLSPEFDEHGDRPCQFCRRVVINSGLNDCYYIDSDGEVCHESIDDWIELENKWMEKYGDKRIS